MGEVAPTRTRRPDVALRAVSATLRAGSELWVIGDANTRPQRCTLIELRTTFNNHPGALVKLDSGATVTIQLSLLREGYVTSGDQP